MGQGEGDESRSSNRSNSSSTYLLRAGMVPEAKCQDLRNTNTEKVASHTFLAPTI